MGHNPYHPPDFDDVTVIGGSLIVKLPRKVKKTSFFEIFKKTRTLRDKNRTATIRRIDVKDADGQLRFTFEPEDGRCSVNVHYERVGGGPPTFRLWLKWMLAGRPSLEPEPDEPHTH